MRTKFVGSFDETMLEDMAEFERRYQGTYLFLQFKENQPEYLVYVEAVQQDQVLCSNPEIGQAFVTRNTNCSFRIAWPKPHLFQDENHMAYCARIPDRQFKRGMTNRNVYFSHPVARFWSKRTLGNQKLLIKHVQAMFSTVENQSIFSVLEAFKKSKSLSSHVLNENWGLSADIAKHIPSSYLLYYHEVPVARVIPKNMEISLLVPHFKQEVSDFNRDYEESKWKITP